MMLAAGCACAASWSPFLAASRARLPCSDCSANTAVWCSGSQPVRWFALGRLGPGPRKRKRLVSAYAADRPVRAGRSFLGRTKYRRAESERLASHKVDDRVGSGAGSG
ncbi:hypothetical protein K456DRAFT_154859 [Colletotrichum gloeosporioides 23]|nr:hypothetical protein K456DRAFT_154859 [Colletotrichum gloeosporioides 23]